MNRLSHLSCALVAAVAASSAPSLAEECSSGARPAATLLIPYFEADVTDPGGLTTLFAVGNAGAVPALAHVVLWTDWGVPTLVFDIYLKKDDVQTVNLRDVFAGRLPSTGGTFEGCTNPLTHPPLGPAEQARLAQQHTGQPDGEDQCSGSGRAGAGIATGFLTIDAANRCSETVRYPFEEGYFAAGGSGLAANDNVLYGDFFYVDPAESFAQGGEAVHIVADAGRFNDEAQTFYTGFALSGGLDARAPLATRYRARYLAGGAFAGGTDLVIWAEPSLLHPQATPCGERGLYVDTCQTLGLTAFDETGQGQEPAGIAPVTEVATRLVVGGPELPVDSPFGFVEVSNRTILACVFIPIGEAPLQSWVMPLHRASGLYSVGLNAVRIADELCQPAP
jgi:hypothetical protein